MRSGLTAFKSVNRRKPCTHAAQSTVMMEYLPTMILVNGGYRTFTSNPHIDGLPRRDEPVEHLGKSQMLILRGRLRRGGALVQLTRSKRTPRWPCCRVISPTRPFKPRWVGGRASPRNPVCALRSQPPRVTIIGHRSFIASRAAGPGHQP